MLQKVLVNIIRLRKRKSNANNTFEIKPLRGQLIKCERETIRRLKYYSNHRLKYQAPSTEEGFRKAPFSRRTSVDGRLNLGNKAAFLNSSGQCIRDLNYQRYRRLYRIQFSVMLHLVNVEVHFRRRLKFSFKSVCAPGPHKVSLFML